MVDDLAASPVTPADEEADHDIAAMNERAAQALALMKTARVGKTKAFIYELPWYLIIGPPGAGKTTALQHAGLDFPVAQTLGDGPVRGIGGTRTIEWWFTDRAVLIDTAGRYTTQDSDQVADGKAWQGLLDLLRQHRPRQPVTGLIVALATTDLIGVDEAAALAHGRAIRQRLNEVQTAFGIRPPVYVILTKLDLLAGFTEFFDDLPQSEREQVWGSTYEFAVAGRSQEPVDDATLGRMFDALIARLDERLLARIQNEPDIGRRGLVFGFPQQVATLRAPLIAMLKVIARETKFEPTPLVRGFYLTSATQFGRPIDRLLNAISARIGVALATPPGDGARGRSYFLHDLLARVVFPEAAIAGRDIKAERRLRAIRLVVLGLAATVVVALTAAWTVAYLRSSALINRLEQRAEIVRRDAAALGRGPIDDDDPQRPLATLDAARALPFASTAPVADRSPGFGWGIGRERALRTEVDGVYVNLLNRQLLPRLLLTLEAELSRLVALGDAAGSGTTAHAPDPRPAIYNLLRVYLMLGRAPGAPLDRSAIDSNFADRWADAYPAEEQSDTRAALAAHLDTLLANPLTPPALNAALIADARARIATLGPGERVYVRMQSDQRLRDLAPFALTDVPGIANSRLFTRRSHSPMSAGVPGMFRHGNFYPVVLPTISRYAAQSADEGWVTGERSQGNAGIGRIKDALLTAYLTDFTNRWDNLIDDIAVSGERPIRDRIQLATRPPSPVRSLFNTLASETKLTPPSLRHGAGGRNALQVGALFSRNIYRGLQRGTSVGSAIETAPAGPPGPLDEVIAHFAWLRDMIPAGGSGPLDQALAALGDVGATSGAATAAGAMGNPALQQQSAATAMAATAKLGSITSTLPPQAGALFQGFVKASTTELNHAARSAVSDEYGAQLQPECESIVKGGYPFANTPLKQVSLDDFSRLFRPSGLFDTFQKTALAGQIDTGSARWMLTPAGKALGLDPAAVARFQDAAKIGAAFFRPGDVRPNVRLTANLVQLSGAQSVTLTVDGDSATFSAGDKRPVELHWPGHAPGASLGFRRVPPPPSPVPPRTWPGEWGLIAMMHDLGGRSANASGVTLAVEEGALHARLYLAIDHNPFAATDLAGFKCPVRL